MEGKRFGIGLAAGILLALAIVAVSGGLASPPSASFAPAGAAISTSTTTVASATFTMSTTTIPQTVTYTVSSISTTSGSSAASLNSSVTYPAASSNTTITGTVSSAPTTNNSNQASLSVVTSTTSTTPYYAVAPSGTSKPTQLASIARQPVVSNAEILAPVLVAFILGAFLYRVATRERERPSED